MRASGRQSEINGCGVQGMSIDFGHFPAFTEICNEHDHCYGKCGVSKDQCDREFSQGMNKYCICIRNAWGLPHSTPPES